MLETIKNKLRVYSQNIVVENKKLEVKQSTKEGSGLGVFALETIPAGVVFLECVDVHSANSDVINKKINDLAYNGDINCYETVENIKNNINVGHIIEQTKHEWMNFFGILPEKVYL